MLLRPLLISLLLAAIAHSSHAATVRLKSEAQPKSTIVYLSDVADIESLDDREADKLARIEITLAPAGSTARYLRASQIQELLDANGIDMRTIQFIGAAQVKLTSAAEPNKKALPKASSYDMRRAERLATEAIRRLLAKTAQADTWKIELKLTNADAARLVRTAGTLTATGGARPWTGGQHFVLHWSTPDGDQQMEVSAEITPPTSVVSTVRAIPRGTLIRAEDVALQPAPNGGRVVQAAFLSIDDVVGKEATRNIPAGQPLDAQTARPPQLVKQNDVVTVYSRAGGISVRTNARARQNGSQGELITVETFDRKPFFARVSGHQEVEVLATPTTLRSPTSAK